MYPYPLLAHVPNYGSDNEHSGKKSKRYDKANTGIDSVITLGLHIFFKLVHVYPSYFLLSISDYKKKIYTK